MPVSKGDRALQLPFFLLFLPTEKIQEAHVTPQTGSPEQAQRPPASRRHTLAKHLLCVSAGHMLGLGDTKEACENSLSGDQWQNKNKNKNDLA